MSARQSEAVTRALKLVARGSTPYAAAKKVGVALSTIYRAIERNRNAEAAPNPPTEIKVPE